MLTTAISLNYFSRLPFFSQFGFFPREMVAFFDFKVHFYRGIIFIMMSLVRLTISCSFIYQHVLSGISTAKVLVFFLLSRFHLHIRALLYQSISHLDSCLQLQTWSLSFNLDVF